MSIQISSLVLKVPFIEDVLPFSPPATRHSHSLKSCGHMSPPPQVHANLSCLKLLPALGITILAIFVIFFILNTISVLENLQEHLNKGR